MFDPAQLNWQDIESDLLEGKDYIDHLKSKREKIIH